MPDGFSRRDFLVGVLLTGTATAAATYFTPNGSRAQNTTLTFLAGVDSTGGRDALVAAWQAANPNAKVDSPPLDGSTLDQSEALSNAIADGGADIVALDVIDVPRFREQGLIVPLEKPPGAFLDKTLIPCRASLTDPSSDYWAAPLSSDVGMLFARGRPTNIPVNDPSMTLSSILGAQVRAQSHQFIGQLQPSSRDSAEAFVVNILEHAISGNPAVLTEDGEPSRELVTWQSALNPLRTAVAAGRVTLSTDEAQTTSTFKSERLQFMRNWPAEYRSLQQAQDADAIASQIQLNELSDGILGGQCLAISRTCRECAAAQDFINFMCSGPAQTVLAAYGVVPAALAPYNDEELQTAVPYLGKVRGAIESSRLRPVHPNYACFSKAIVDNLGSFPTTGQGLTSQFIDEIFRCLA